MAQNEWSWQQPYITARKRIKACSSKFIVQFCFWWILAITSTIAVMTITKSLYQSAGLHIVQIVSSRHLIATTILLPFVFRSIRNSWHSVNRKVVISKGVTSTISVLTLTQIYTHIPLHTATLISFFSPIIATVIAIYILNEKIYPKRIVAILLGFFGVFITVIPSIGDSSGPTIYYTLALLVTFITASSNVMNKILSSGETTTTQTVFYCISVPAILTTLISLATLKQQSIPSVESSNILLLLGVITVIQVFSIINTYKIADLSVVQSLDFSKVIALMAVDYYIFKDSTNVQELIGGGVIFASSTYVLHLERREKIIKQRFEKTYRA